MPHRQRLRHAGVRRPGRRIDRQGGRPAGAGRRARPAQARSPRARQARDLPLHERRALAGRQLRSQADARQVPRAAAARRRDRHRAEDRRADAIAVHVQEIRQGGHRGQRAVSARRRVRGRHLLHPLDAHRHSEPRTVDADDEHRPHAGRPAVARIVADLRPRHRQQEPARLRRAVPGRPDDRRPAALEQRVSPGGASGHLHRRQGREGETDRHRAGRQGLRSEDADLLHPQREVHADRAAARAGSAGRAQPRADGAGTDPRSEARSGDSVDGNRLPHADRGAGGVRHPEGERGDAEALRRRAARRAAA